MFTPVPPLVVRGKGNIPPRSLAAQSAFRSTQVEEFDPATSGGVWVAAGAAQDKSVDSLVTFLHAHAAPIALETDIVLLPDGSRDTVRAIPFSRTISRRDFEAFADSKRFVIYPYLIYEYEDPYGNRHNVVHVTHWILGTTVTDNGLQVHPIKRNVEERLRWDVGMHDGADLLSSSVTPAMKGGWFEMLVVPVIVPIAVAIVASLITAFLTRHFARRDQLRAFAGHWRTVLVELGEILNRIHYTAVNRATLPRFMPLNEIHITEGLRQEFYSRSEDPDQSDAVVALYDFVAHCQSNLAEALYFWREAMQYPADSPQRIPFIQGVDVRMGSFMWMATHRHEGNRQRLIESRRAFVQFCKDHGIEQRLTFDALLELPVEMRRVEGGDTGT